MDMLLKDMACARSGDKGPNANVGLIFKDKEAYDWACKEITAEKVKEHFKGIVKGNVIRYELPNLFAMNFILEDSLGGGGSETLFNDAQGKTYGQALLLMSINKQSNH